MKRRGLFFGAAALLVSPDALCAPEPFNVRKLETVVFRQVYDGYAEQNRQRKGPHWLRHSHEYTPSDADQLAFYHDVRECLVRHFDTIGWPTEAPRICVLPPNEYVRDFADSLGGYGFIGCEPKGGKPRFWELRRGGWIPQDPAMFSVKPTA